MHFQRAVPEAGPEAFTLLHAIARRFGGGGGAEFQSVGMADFEICVSSVWQFLAVCIRVCRNDVLCVSVLSVCLGVSNLLYERLCANDMCSATFLPRRITEFVLPLLLGHYHIQAKFLFQDCCVYPCVSQNFLVRIRGYCDKHELKVWLGPVPPVLSAPCLHVWRVCLGNAVAQHLLGEGPKKMCVHNVLVPHTRQHTSTSVLCSVYGLCTVSACRHSGAKWCTGKHVCVLLSLLA